MEPVTEQQGGAPKGPANPARLLAAIEGAMTGLAAAAIFAMAAYICYGVIARNVLNISVSDETVIIGELMIMALVLPLARVAAEQGFIVVELLTERFAARHRVVLSVLAVLVGLIAALSIGYAGLRAFGDAWSSQSFYFGVLNWPEWPGKLAFLLGYAFFNLRLLVLLVEGATSGARPAETA